MADGPRVLLVVSGGIAAYKSAILVRRLRQAGATVDVVMTTSAVRMVGTATFHALSGRPVHADLWTEPLAHIALGREADLAIVAPATAHILARMAHGMADDMATSTLLAANCPVLVCPAMNVRMWENEATRHNVDMLRERGVEVLGPDEGELAEAEVGAGRMVEPEIVSEVAQRLLGRATSRLADRKVLVTAGPTRAPIDPVRYVGNRSSGRMGFALAGAAWRRGADVVLIAGPTSAPMPHGPRLVREETSVEMLAALERELEGASLLLMAAAVSDFMATPVADRKIKRAGSSGLDVHLEPGPDLLVETIDRRAASGVFSVGFALETEDALDNARRKLESKGLDLIAVNQPGPDTAFDVDTNRITLLDPAGLVEELPLSSKRDIAEKLLDVVEERIP
jgi:phosphopantothenoylcysteine decarboxylase/phosphopantothenate--cysteine ligase